MSLPSIAALAPGRIEAMIVLDPELYLPTWLPWPEHLYALLLAGLELPPTVSELCTSLKLDNTKTKSSCDV